MADTKEIINCPACGKPMKKVFIPSEKINIDICTEGCGGIFFDNREFDKFNEQNEDISVIIEELQNKTFESVNTEATRNCPVCGMKMVQNKTSINGEILVDDCYGCGGKFLDYAELEKIRAEFATDNDRSRATMAYLNQRVGKELSLLDAKHQNIARHQSMGQKLFFTLMGVK